MALFDLKPVLFICSIPLLMMLHQNSRTSFEFSNFSSPCRNVIFTYQGDASASNGVIQLTKVREDSAIPGSVGRATYTLPVHLWDAKTRKLASFITTFSFLVKKTSAGFGDGISFFLAPFESEIPKNSGGGYLGLFNPESASRTFENQIVAVEFDTFSNPWDPKYQHIGIDVNSIVSVVTEPWLNLGHDVTYITAFATVTYESAARNLSVEVSYYSGSTLSGSPVSISLSHVVDLKMVLPELVSVGFSGATGRHTEVNDILSWTFSSGFN